MNVHSSSCDPSFQASELQRVGISVFVSKYKLRMITIKEHHFHNKDNRLL
jgi:hypothetical protein